MLGEAGFPHSPTAVSRRASSPGPSPLHARRTLTPHLSSHVLDTGQVPHQSQGSGGAAQGAWCWPGGHVTRSSLEREGCPPSLFTGRDCAVPFCLCNINTDFYTSPLCLPVLSIPVLGFPPLSPLGGLGGPHHCIGSLGFLGDPADHGPPLPRSRLPAPQYQSCLPGHPLEMKVGSRWKPSPCHPGSLCQAGGLAASLTWPLGLGHDPEDSGALRVSRAGPLSFAGASAASMSSAPRAQRPLALRAALGEALEPSLGVPGTPCCAGGGVRPARRLPEVCGQVPPTCGRGSGGTRGDSSSSSLPPPPASSRQKQYSSLLYWVSPWGHL